MIDFKQYSDYIWIAIFVFWYATAINSKRTIKREPMFSRYFCVIVIACILAFTFTGNKPSSSFLGQEIISNKEIRGWAGLLLTFVSLSFAAWARISLGTNWSGDVTLKEDHELITSGAYSVTRNPIYTGFLFAVLGHAIIMGVAKGFVIALILSVAVLVKIQREEIFLSSHFGDAYDAYRKRVKKIIPLLW